ncbi:MAG: D-alanine--D-alanine ligase family protein [Bacteroidota bacterium]
MSKTTVALIFGGKSVEHEISVRSAKNIYQNLDKEKYRVELIGIDKEGVWKKVESIGDGFEKGQSLSVTLGQHGVFETESGAKLPEFDVVFPIVHGTDGEDGNIQGFFNLLDIPVVGSNVEGSVISMSKLTSKELLSASGIPVCKYKAFDLSEKEHIQYDEIVKILGLPFILKPSNLGSSVGVYKIKTEEDFNTYLDNAFEYDNQIIFEEFVEGYEMECAVKGNEIVKATVPGEVILKGDHEFYSYEAKYLDAKASETIIPATISETHFDSIKDLCIRAFKALKCADYGRVDLFLSKSGVIYINEINTLPGFTDISMFPKLWEYEGVKYSDLIDELIQLSLKRFERQKRLQTNYKQAI